MNRNLGGSCARLTDSDRVLGQIVRGEVTAGPDGARIIAARHERAYGEVWNDAWTAALEAVSEEAVTT